MILTKFVAKIQALTKKLTKEVDQGSRGGPFWVGLMITPALTPNRCEKYEQILKKKKYLIQKSILLRRVGLLRVPNDAKYRGRFFPPGMTLQLPKNVKKSNCLTTNQKNHYNLLKIIFFYIKSWFLTRQAPFSS